MKHFYISIVLAAALGFLCSCEQPVRPERQEELEEPLSRIPELGPKPDPAGESDPKPDPAVQEGTGHLALYMQIKDKPVFNGSIEGSLRPLRIDCGEEQVISLPSCQKRIFFPELAAGGYLLTLHFRLKDKTIDSIQRKIFIEEGKLCTEFISFSAPEDLTGN